MWIRERIERVVRAEIEYEMTEDDWEDDEDFRLNMRKWR